MKYLKSTLLQFKLCSNFSWYQVPARFTHYVFPFDDKYITFDKSLHKIICEVRSERKYLEIIPNFEKNIQETIKYSGRGSNNISKIMLTAYNMIENQKNITTELDHQAFVLAWAAQMVDSYKILRYTENGHKDESKQKFCIVDVGTVGNSDLLRSFIYVMIEQNFQDTKCYQIILQLCNKAFLYSAIGQYFDHSASKLTNTQANINANLYEKLCDFKISYPYFEFPLLLALTLANKANMELLHSVSRICSEMGMLYQIQEDFDNCFGTDSMIGTGGTDIQKGKCTWLAVTALQRFTPRQRIVFEACYGSEEPAHVERVKLLYEQLQIRRLFREREGGLHESIMQQAETLEKSGIPSKLFEELLISIRQG